MSAPEHEVRMFRRVSRKVVTRLFLQRWFGLLDRSAAIVYPAAAAAVVGAWYFGWIWLSASGAALLVSAWLGLTAGWAWLLRPTPVAALARG